jgi:anaerobic magnesium-protoporphyrin IX monomethyl ester cyclase
MATRNTVYLINIAAPFREGIPDMTRPPSGILYVGGYLKRHGYHVKVRHIAERDLDLTAREVAEDPETLFVGFSLMTGRQVTLSARAADAIKARRGDCVVVWGGIHPSTMPDACLRFAGVDYVVIGEGELTALELANALRDGRTDMGEMAGVGFKRGGEIVVNPMRPFAEDMDEFQQDWDLVDIRRYIRPTLSGRRSFCFITSRGCPHTCGFCYNQKFNLRKWRGHSVEYVIREVSRIQKLTGIDMVNFDDDNFFTKKKRGLDILRALKGLGITCEWVELRVDYMHADLLDELVALGVFSVFTGWESGNAETLKRVAKGITPQTILEKTRLLAGYRSLVVDASSIIGFPWETRRHINDTIDLALRMFRIKPFLLNFNIGIYVPFPGAPVTAEAEAAGFRFPQDAEGWSRFDILSGAMRLPWMHPRDVARYTLIDKYAKLLYVPPFLKGPMRAAALVVAVLAYARLKMRLLVFPFEVWLSDIVKRRVYARRDSQPSAA